MSIPPDPEENYATPDDILKDQHLSQTDKLKALKSWEADLIALLRADDENMPGDSPPPPSGNHQENSASRKETGRT